MYKILCVGTHSIDMCSLKSSLTFIIKIYYVHVFFFLLHAWYGQRPTTLRGEPKSTEKNGMEWPHLASSLVPLKCFHFLASYYLANHESDSHCEWNIENNSGDSELFAESYQQDFILRSLLKMGIQWGFTQRGWATTPALSVQQQTENNCVGGWEWITCNKRIYIRRNQAEGVKDKWKVGQYK